jgi:hypothetical protein
MLGEIAAGGAASFLSVLKVFGERPSPGMLSFPRRGPRSRSTSRIAATRRSRCSSASTRSCTAAGGAIYPAKDARMSPATFASSFPRIGEFEPHVDPAFSSSFWRRVRAHG